MIASRNASRLFLLFCMATGHAAFSDAVGNTMERSETSSIEATSLRSEATLNQKLMGQLTVEKKSLQRNDDEEVDRLAVLDRQLKKQVRSFVKQVSDFEMMGDEIMFTDALDVSASESSYRAGNGVDDDDDGKAGKKGGHGGKKGGDDDDSGYYGGKNGGYNDDNDDDIDCPEDGEQIQPRQAFFAGCVLHPNDNPCEEGCGHGTVLNPYRDPAQALADSDYKPAPCLEYRCICADSGCQMSWGPGCIAEYISCQETQVCGSLSAQPTSVTSYNFGSCPNYAFAQAPTPECVARPATPAPTKSPTTSPTHFRTHRPTHAPTPCVKSGDDDDDGKGGKSGKKGGYGGDDDDGAGKAGGKSDKKGEYGGDDDDSVGKSGKKGDYGGDDDVGAGKAGGTSGKKGGFGGDDDDGAGKAGGKSGKKSGYERDDDDDSGKGKSAKQAGFGGYNDDTVGKAGGKSDKESGYEGDDDGPGKAGVKSGKKVEYGADDDDSAGKAGGKSGKKGGDDVGKAGGKSGKKGSEDGTGKAGGMSGKKGGY